MSALTGARWCGTVPRASVRAGRDAPRLHRDGFPLIRRTDRLKTYLALVSRQGSATILGGGTKGETPIGSMPPRLSCEYWGQAENSAPCLLAISYDGVQTSGPKLVKADRRATLTGRWPFQKAERRFAPYPPTAS